MGNNQSEKAKTLDGGKGSTQRPVDRQKFDTNWDRIFNKKEADKLDKKFEEDFSKIFGK